MVQGSRVEIREVNLGNPENGWLSSPHHSPRNPGAISDTQYRPILLCFFLLL